MALITCRDCGKQIGTIAKACPNCGAQPKKPRSKLYIFLIILAAMAIFGSRSHETVTTPSPGANSPTTLMAEQVFPICKAAIALLFNREPVIIRIDKTESEVVYLSYLRAEDATHWNYRRKLVQDRVYWAMDNNGTPGRWRVADGDEQVTWKRDDGTIAITVDYADGSRDRKVYDRSNL